MASNSLLKTLGVAALAVGAASALFKKPNGETPTDDQPSNVNKGSATVGGTDPARAKEDLRKAEREQEARNKRSKRRGIENQLETFASYTTVFTLACLKKEELNNPYLYRTADFASGQVVLSSAGRYDKQRVPTAYGSPEFYIDNLVINTAIAPNEGTGASNAITISFDVIEPYSGALFLQSLQTAAITSGYANYLDGTPFVLKMEFLGYTQDGKLYKGVQPKFFVLTLRKCNFTITEGGSKYAVEATPYNHIGFSNLINTVFNDVSIVGGTVKELLSTGERSLQNTLKEREEKSVKDGLKTYPNVYEVHFPQTSSDPIPGVEPTSTVDRATVNASNRAVKVATKSNSQNDSNFQNNPIGSASFGFKADSGGTYVAPRADQTYDQATGKVVRDNVTIDAKSRTFQYAQGQSLIAIMSQAIMASEYAIKAVAEPPDEKGQLSWFRIDVQIQLLEYDAKIGEYQKRFIYRVMPYKVHSSVFSNPNAIPYGYDALEKEIVKQYDYIYTGQNNDLLKFDIELNTAFYTAIAPSPPQDAGRSANQDVLSSGQEERNQAKTEEGNAGIQAQASKLGGTKVRQDPNAIKLPFGGSGQLKPEEIVANNFHLAFLQNGQANLVNVNIEILGDPYWLIDNGIGGYMPPPGQTSMITADGSANYEAGDIYIYLRFRSPIEPKESAGDYLFVNEEDSPFSGIYKVIKCENRFSGGTFRQSLNCVRMPLQASDFDEKVTPTKTNTSLYNVKEPEPPKSEVYDV
jgi:hypothetical protein